ncbi:MAG: acylphosphatase [Actinobacteria bacterium]|nr:acylphosphatase [Actinomycetota bacterium]
MTVVRRRVVVDGRVQGVFFRETCRREATGAGVAGWAANRSDGKVEAVFEGPVEAVDRLVEWCRRGPPSARVLDVTVRDETPRGEHGFRVVEADA